MRTQAEVLKWLRQIHLYLGVFTAPAILFFAFTGFLQTFSLHEISRDGAYKPAGWIVELAQIHKKQTIQLPVSKPQPPASSSSAEPAKAKKPIDSPQAGNRPAHNAFPLKIFFGVVCAALFASTLTGLYMAYKYRRNIVLLTVLLLGGIIIPIALTML